MRLVIIILSLLLFTSCVEVSNNEFLVETESMITEVDSLETLNRSIHVQNLHSIVKWSDSIDLKVRKLFKPVPYEIGKQITAFSQLKSDLSPFESSDTIISKRLISQKTRLIHLKTDIENGSGRRSHYNKYINSEKSNIDSLRLLIFQRDSAKTRIIRTFNELETILDSNLNVILSKEY